MPNEQVAELERKLTDDPRSEAFSALAAHLLAAGRADRAAAICEQGLVHHPDHATGRIVLGKALLRLGRAADARGQFEEVLARHRNDGEVYRSVGEALHERGLYRSACQILRRAARLLPEDERLAALLADAESRASQPPRGASPGAGPSPEAPPAAGAGKDPAPAAGRVADAPAKRPTAGNPAVRAKPEASAGGAAANAPPRPNGAPPTEGSAAAAAANAPPRPNGAPPTEGGATAAAANAPPRPNGAPPTEGSAAANAPPRPDGAPPADTSAAAANPPPRPDPAAPPPLPARPGGEPVPPPLPGQSEVVELLGALPEAPADAEPPPPPADPASVAKEAANAAAAYERELRERLARENPPEPPHPPRRRLGRWIAGLAVVAALAAGGAYQFERARTREADVTRFSAAARMGLARDTRPAYVATLAALDEVLDREPEHASARALRAQTLATLGAVFGEPDRAAAARELLGAAEAEAEPAATLVARWLLAEGADARKAVEEEVLAYDAAKASAELDSLAGAVWLDRSEPARAIERFNAAIEKEPGHVRTLVRVADYYRRRSEHADALRYYGLVLGLVGEHPGAVLGAAESTLASSRDAKALGDMLAALDEIPPADVAVDDRPRRAMLRARLLAALGRREEALSELEPLRSSADDALLPRLATAYVQVGAPDRASALFQVDRMTAGASLEMREAWARALLAEERFEAAAAVPAKPGERSLHLLKGVAHYHLGRLRSARAALRRTAGKQAGKLPADAVAYLALVDLAAGDVEKARRNLERLGGSPRARSVARWALGTLQVRTGRLSDAEATFRAAIEREPFSVEATCGLGRLLLGRGEDAAAEELLAAAVALNPFHAEARLAQAAALQRLGRLAEAKAQLEVVLEQHPGHPDALAALARPSPAGGEPDAALAKKALAAAPKTGLGWAAQAELHAASGESKSALRKLRRAVALDPSDATTWTRLGELSLATGDVRGAERAFGRALSIRPSWPRAEAGIARALADKGKAAQGAASLEKAIQAAGERLDPAGRAALLAVQADLLVAAGEAKAGLEHARAALDLREDEAAAHLAAARALGELGRAAQAERHLERARAIAAGTAAVVLGEVRQLVAKGERPKARERLAEWLERAPLGPERLEARRLLDELRKRR